MTLLAISSLCLRSFDLVARPAAPRSYVVLLAELHPCLPELWVQCCRLQFQLGKRSAEVTLDLCHVRSCRISSTGSEKLLGDLSRHSSTFCLPSHASQPHCWPFQDPNQSS